MYSTSDTICVTRITVLSFANLERNSVENFLIKAAVDVNVNQSVVQLYAQWNPKSYTLVFDTNRPTTKNNTHASTNEPMAIGTMSMEFVWDSYIIDGKINFETLPVIEAEVRNILLRWLSKALEHKESKGKTEDGQVFHIVNREETKYCTVSCKDGDFEMPSFILEFEA